MIEVNEQLACNFNMVIGTTECTADFRKSRSDAFIL